MIIICTTLLSNDNPHADAVAFGFTIKPISVRNKVIELDVVAVITKISIDFIIIVNVLYSLYFFLDLLFLSLKYVIIPLMLLI